MGKVTIRSLSLEDSYASISFIVQITKEYQTRINYRIIDSEPVVRFDNYLSAKQIVKTLDILRGFITDKRNYKQIEDEMKERLMNYANSARDTSRSNDRDYYFTCYERGIMFLEKVSKNMGLGEETTHDIRAELESIKNELSVTQ